jgi:hypothetical protein
VERSAAALFVVAVAATKFFRQPLQIALIANRSMLTAIV